jgi:pimeloyl-ACP methyl ester carboxylesterase
MGGKGDPVVLLHGYPQSWYEWRYVMPDLAKKYTVVAPDLRGFGDTSKPMTGYDGKTIAKDILALGGDIYPALGGDYAGNFAYSSLQSLAPNVTGITVPLSGHWIPEEQPKFVVDQLFKFFGSK